MLQQAVMGEKMEEMSQEERKDFVNEQMDALQHELEKASAVLSTQSTIAGLHICHRNLLHAIMRAARHLDACVVHAQAAQGIPDAADTAMSQQEQSGFLKASGKSGKDV